MIAITLYLLFVAWSLWSFVQAGDVHQLYYWYQSSPAIWPTLLVGQALSLGFVLVLARLLMPLLWRSRRDPYRLLPALSFFASLVALLAGVAVVLELSGPENANWGGAGGHFIARRLFGSLDDNVATLLILASNAVLLLFHIRLGWNWLWSAPNGQEGNRAMPEQPATAPIAADLSQEDEDSSRKGYRVESRFGPQNRYFETIRRLESQARRSAGKARRAAIPWFSRKKVAGPVPFVQRDWVALVQDETAKTGTDDRKWTPKAEYSRSYGVAYPKSGLVFGETARKSRTSKKKDDNKENNKENNKDKHKKEFPAGDNSSSEDKSKEQSLKNQGAGSFWDSEPTSLSENLKIERRNEVFIFRQPDEDFQADEKALEKSSADQQSSIADASFGHQGADTWPSDARAIYHDSEPYLSSFKENLEDEPVVEANGEPGRSPSAFFSWDETFVLDESPVPTDSPQDPPQEASEAPSPAPAPGEGQQPSDDSPTQSNQIHEDGEMSEQELPDKEETAGWMGPGQTRESFANIDEKNPDASRVEPDILYFQKEEVAHYAVDADVFESSSPENSFVQKTEGDLGAKKLEKTLKEFSVDARVVGYKRGPVVTMYEVSMAPGIKVNRIVNLADDLAMAFATESVRIIAPIPGKSAVGIEVPNKTRSLVRLRDLSPGESPDDSWNLQFPLGKQINGEIMHIDITRMPHLLIAGATGSGKSVCVNSIITSLIYQYDPSDVRFMLIDPKLVELQLYNGIPHLLYPVITDAKTATVGLYWVVQEMEKRYRLLSELGVRDLKSYNEKAERYRSQGDDSYIHLPYLVILIDEFADLMLVASKELEDFVTRIAQKARAVGIHLLLATQRPSVNIITGVIKANFPARIAFQVASKIDSRTIIDTNGAEKLLGKGDMLFQSPYSSFPSRLQGAMVTEEEINRIVRQAKAMAKPRYIELQLPEDDTTMDDSDFEDSIFEQALEIVIESRKASASYLQRRLRIGYNRAARLIERMEELGYIGEAQGSRSREILVDHL